MENLKNNDILELDISDMKWPNIGIANYGNYKFNIKGAIKGQKIKARIEKIKRRKAKLLNIIEKSEFEIEPLCPVFGICGGCSFQNIEYEHELFLKEYMVKKILEPFQIQNFLPSIAAPQNKYYRNKMEFSFGDSGVDSELTLGMRKKGSFYESVDAINCNIAPKDFSKIVDYTLKFFKEKRETFYHRNKKTGLLRHLVIRKGYKTDQIMINLITALEYDCSEYVDEVLKLKLDGTISSIYHTISHSVSDAVIADKIGILYGNEFIIEKTDEDIGDLEFKINPFSFYQTNSEAAQILYKTICSMAGNIDNKIIFDLYCGMGTIAQALAFYGNPKEIIGIEIMEDAVFEASSSVKRHNLSNLSFISGKVEAFVKDIKKSPDLIILDPPREGINPKGIKDILKFNSKEIIYVSCKPTSLAQDLPHFLEYGYSIKEVQCIDIFPRTANIETIVKLSLN